MAWDSSVRLGHRMQDTRNKRKLAMPQARSQMTRMSAKERNLQAMKSHTKIIIKEGGIVDKRPGHNQIGEKEKEWIWDKF